jgi:hypothetical protein
MILILTFEEQFTWGTSASCTSSTHTKSNLYFAISIVTDVNEPAL